jgi:hypothetical protein
MSVTIKTSEIDWLEKAVKCFTEKSAFTFVDDAKMGLTETDLKSAVNLIRGAKSKGNKTWKSIVGVLTGIGITGAGVYIIMLAIIDPEPTTKLGLLVGGGLLIALTGSLGVLSSLGVNFNVSAKSAIGHFEITPK